MSWCTQLWLALPDPWSSQVLRISLRPCTPPCAFVQLTNACSPYCGPTNARGSNGLVLLTMLPIVIVVGVTPMSDAVLGPDVGPGAPGLLPPPGSCPSEPPGTEPLPLPL